MNKEILFRGKAISGTHRDRNTGEWIGAGTWVEGFFVNCSSIFDDREKDRIPEIVEYMADRQFTGEYCWTDVHEVDPETVSQFTGKKDVDGKKIFGGDIVQFCEDSRYAFEVAYHGCEWCLVNGVDPRLIHYYCSLANYQQLKVIGNIWDNPELLGGKDE